MRPSGSNHIVDHPLAIDSSSTPVVCLDFHHISKTETDREYICLLCYSDVSVTAIVFPGLHPRLYVNDE